MDPKLLVDYLQSQQSLIVTALTQWPTALLGGIAAIGFLTMTMVEVSKVNKRTAFHRQAVERWIDMVDFSHVRSVEGVESNVSALADLVSLATAGNKEALFSLSTEHLCGQIAAATQSVLDSPHSHKQLLLHLLGSSILREDLLKDVEFILNYLPHVGNKENESLNQRFVTTRNKVAACIQRNVDALQITTAFEWQRLMRNTSIKYSYAISFLGSILFASSVNFFSVIMFALVSGYLGGFFASMFRDVLSAVERIKR